MGHLQHIWDAVVAHLGSSSFTYEVICSQLLLWTVEFCFGAIFTVLDLTLSPKAIRKYKSQQGANEPMDMVKFKTLLKLVLLNNVVVAPFVTYFVYRVNLWYNGPLRIDELATLPEAFTVGEQLGLK